MSATDSPSRPVDRRTVVRLSLAGVVVLASAPVLLQYAVALADGEGVHPPAPPRDGRTAIADQSGHLLVYGANGSVVYDDHRYDRYWDVDPVPGRPDVLFYTATEEAPGACPGGGCERNVVGLLNLSTRERTRLFSRVVRTRGSHEWHDVDRVNATHVAVADIRHDRLLIADVRTDEVTWAWNASEYYPPSSGGPSQDWTHVNDVEVLPDGRLMASIRNMDQVVFVEPGAGVRESWTLGEEGNHSILFGQHNPDYIPESRGGPAVVVADSHNNRVVEYQRENGTWTQSWQWSDGQMQWTRDADRLPNGHTLITDTNGDRVLEVDERGRVVWSVPTSKSFEAERLSTGDESAGGESAAALGLDSHTGPRRGSLATRLSESVVELLPAFAFNSLLYVVPVWMGQGTLVLVWVAALALVGWLGLECYWLGGPRAVVGILSGSGSR